MVIVNHPNTWVTQQKYKYNSELDKIWSESA